MYPCVLVEGVFDARTFCCASGRDGPGRRFCGRSRKNGAAAKAARATRPPGRQRNPHHKGGGEDEDDSEDGASAYKQQHAAFGENRRKNKLEDAMNQRPPSTRAEVVLAAFTILIFITYLTSNYFLWKQSVIGKIAADAAASAADTAQKSLASSNKTAADTLTEMKKQSEAMQEAAGAAASQSQIARESLAAARATFRLEQRPWVGLQLLQCNNCRMESDGSLIIGDLSAVLVNTGKTPAIDMVVQWTFESIKASDPIPTYDVIEKESKTERERVLTIPTNLPPDIAADIAKSIELTKRRMLPSKEVLAPNAARGITIIAGLKQGRDIRARREDWNVIYGLGKITYYDTFHTIQHTTMFCVMNEFGTIFRYCPTGNEMN